jgi:sulfonate transport system substrate-binding protein
MKNPRPVGRHTLFRFAPFAQLRAGCEPHARFGSHILSRCRSKTCFALLSRFISLSLKDVLRPTSLWFGIAMMFLGTIAYGQNEQLSAVRIGYQKYGTLNVVKAEGGFEKSLTDKGVKVTWILFTAGPQLMEALNAGSIDFGNAGEAPPVFAQAAGVNFVYFGNQPPDPKGEAVLVRKDSPIKSIQDLRGKRIALNKGSNVHFFLVKVLEKNGLKVDDTTPTYLPPADAWAAFEGGSVDAWAIWDPFLTAAIVKTGARVLQDGENVIANREFFLADRSFAQAHQDVLLSLREAIDRCARWTQAKPDEIVHYLAPQLGMSEEVINTVVRRQSWGFQPIGDQVTSDQQAIADTFFSLKLIPKSVHVADVVLRLPQVAVTGRAQ